MPGSKPTHPATVHFPIAFLTLSYTLTLLHYTTTTTLLPTSLSQLLTPHLPALAQTSHILLALGILSGIVSIITGGLEIQRLISNAGMYEADGTTLRPKIKVAFTHAAMNDAVVVLAGWSWWVIYRSGSVNGKGGGVVAPTGVNLGISAVSLPALLFSASLGGRLVYNYGVGMRLGKKGKSS